MSMFTTQPVAETLNFGTASNSRIFLVGNGASLKHTKLDLLIGKPSMAVNKIHKIYGFTLWRPTHYVKVDYSPFDDGDWQSEVMPHVGRGEKCLLWSAFHGGITSLKESFEIRGDGVGARDNVEYIGRCKHHNNETGAWHEICTGHNSILTMAIWAVQLGFTEIVLVGCDGYFTTPLEDHFIADYYKTWDVGYTERNNRNVVAAHEIIKEFCPVPVYDATVDGHLTMYPKVRLEDYA